MKKIILIVSMIFTISAGQAQDAGGLWKTLADVTYKTKFDKMLGIDVNLPVFGKQVKVLDGKEITVKGYIIPMEGYKGQEYFVLSQFPYNMCFFCGGAGPETVMEVYAKSPIKYTTKMVTLKGKLLLNDDDANKLMYMLTEAVLVPVK